MMLLAHALTLAEARSHLAALADQGRSADASIEYDRVLLPSTSSTSTRGATTSPASAPLRAPTATHYSPSRSRPSRTSPVTELTR